MPVGYSIWPHDTPRAAAGQLNHRSVSTSQSQVNPTIIKCIHKVPNSLLAATPRSHWTRSWGALTTINFPDKSDTTISHLFEGSTRQRVMLFVSEYPVNPIISPDNTVRPLRISRCIKAKRKSNRHDGPWVTEKGMKRNHTL